jgi:hypothetical protein
MAPDFEVEIYSRRGFFGKRYYWRLRSTDNGQIVTASRGGKGSGYANPKDCARMVDRIFQELYPIVQVS